MRDLTKDEIDEYLDFVLSDDVRAGGLPSAPRRY